MMNILLLEDDKLQREYLAKIIEKNYIDIRIYEAGTISKASSILKEKQIDLFLVDINLPDGSGLEFIKKVREVPKYNLTGVVFITSQVVQIIDAFKNTHCYDFLIKPYNVDDIKRIIDIFYNQRSNEVKNRDFIVVPLEGGISVKVYEDDIVFIEYFKRRCIIHTKKYNHQCKILSLSKISQMIKSESIIQSHKSYLVNIKYIEKIEKVYSKGWEIYFSVIKEVAPLSSSYRNELLETWLV